VERVFVAVADAEVAARIHALSRDDVKTFRMGYWKRAEEEGVDQAAGGGAGTESEGEGEDCGGGGDFIFAELPETEDGVGAKGIEPGKEFGVAAVFTMADLRAESAVGFLQVAAVGDGFCDVRFELFVEFAVEAIGAERIGDAGDEGH
jgi:hypothetical protein